ncbi:MAG TPA: cell division protein FtsZ [Parasegetibacter sp.]
MIHFDLPKEKSSIIKVIGVGGGGSNAVNHMYSQNIEGVNFIICNTDAQALAQSSIPNKIQLGPLLTQGLGAGANPEIGRQAVEESLDEIRSILEVNTKMAFITAGMGGGTGTGGAPIISKICKDLGILTVGIVTTPFAYEGKRRQQQAQDGINRMKEYVDTLLVISNDKLRHQFGNLTMRAAFSKADNVLATAAKCITDVINSTGQINVDFADVCTVMRNGGVAILGSATAEGENRAQKAIEDALNSPLLNDNDIRGARWILININSAEGDNEFTMDEVEIIQNYLLSQAGDDTDVILGMGYDNSLDNKIGITLIATGFEHKDPFATKQVAQPVVKKEEKIVMTLGEPDAEKKLYAPPVSQKVEEEKVDPLAPVIKEAPVAEQPLHAGVATPIELKLDFNDEVSAKKEDEQPVQLNLSKPENPAVSQPANKEAVVATSNSGGYLAKPSNIYTETTPELNSQNIPMAEPTFTPERNNEPVIDMQLVFKEEIPLAADTPNADHTQDITNSTFFSEEEPAMLDESEIQKRKAAERIQKLRNLSFNINGNDPNNEFETVPAYIRRNMELYNSSSLATVENFYSSMSVKSDENNQGQISTINTFLEGKKPD